MANGGVDLTCLLLLLLSGTSRLLLDLMLHCLRLLWRLQCGLLERITLHYVCRQYAHHSTRNGASYLDRHDAAGLEVRWILSVARWLAS